MRDSRRAVAPGRGDMLRRRIGEGNGEAGDRVGAAFREWRGERVERLAGD